jgi:alanine racemase
VRPGQGDSGPGFLPVLSLHSTVLRVKTVPAGSGIGYGASFRTTRESRLATLAIGYDDGLPRALSGKGEVLVHGRRAPLIGAISMDLSVADVTDCGEVRPGDEVVVIGTQEGESIEVARRWYPSVASCHPSRMWP